VPEGRELRKKRTNGSQKIADTVLRDTRTTREKGVPRLPVLTINLRTVGEK